MNNRDGRRRYFCTTGIVAAFFPSAFDSSSTAPAANYAASVFKAGDEMTLVGLVVLTRPAANDVVTLKDSAGTAFLPDFTVPTSTAGSDPFAYHDWHIPVPKGGFSVTTTQANSVYLWVFDIQKSIV